MTIFHGTSLTMSNEGCWLVVHKNLIIVFFLFIRIFPRKFVTKNLRILSAVHFTRDYRKSINVIHLHGFCVSVYRFHCEYFFQRVMYHMRLETRFIFFFDTDGMISRCYCSQIMMCSVLAKEGGGGKKNGVCCCMHHTNNLYYYCTTMV